jgi:hypothetical protein
MMDNKFKTLGLAVLAITAMSAVTASAANAAAFTGAGGKNAMITVDQTATNEFLVETGIVKCAAFKIPPKTVVNGSTTVQVHPEYSMCKTFGVAGTVTTTGCDYLIHLEAGGASKTDVVCAGANLITIDARPALECVVTVGSQNGLTGVTYSNGASDVVQTLDVTNQIIYKESGTGCKTNGVFSANGTYRGTNTITGFEDIGGSEGPALAISVDF